MTEKKSPSTEIDTRTATSPDTNAPETELPTQAGPGTEQKVEFAFQLDGNTYDVGVFVPDATGQYGFLITKATGTAAATPVGGLTYKDPKNWQVQIDLPTSWTIDPQLTVQSLNVTFGNGAVGPLT